MLVAGDEREEPPARFLESKHTGCSGASKPMANCTNAPIESLDLDFDFFRIIEYSLVTGSGGAGEFRGGLGIRRRYKIVCDGVQYAQYGDRFVTRPAGLLGGEPGASASCWILREGKVVSLKSKDFGELRRGDILTVQTGGGAGYGPPERRDPVRARQDIEEGYVVS
jgi:N-methylhydantoinase B